MEQLQDDNHSAVIPRHRYISTKYLFNLSPATRNHCLFFHLLNERISNDWNCKSMLWYLEM